MRNKKSKSLIIHINEQTKHTRRIPPYTQLVKPLFAFYLPLPIKIMDENIAEVYSKNNNHSLNIPNSIKTKRIYLNLQHVCKQGNPTSTQYKTKNYIQPLITIENSCSKGITMEISNIPEKNRRTLPQDVPITIYYVNTTKTLSQHQFKGRLPIQK